MVGVTLPAALEAPVLAGTNFVILVSLVETMSNIVAQTFRCCEFEIISASAFLGFIRTILAIYFKVTECFLGYALTVSTT